jgi:hypothetical protein
MGSLRKQLFLLCLFASPGASSAPEAGLLAPADPATPVPAAKYESAFAGYARYRDEDLAPWRAVNDEVARAGGHAGIVGGAGHSTPDSRKPAAGSPPSPSQAVPRTTHDAGHK